MLEGRDQEGGSLTGSSLRLAGHIFSLKSQRQGGGLDGGAVNESCIGDALAQVGSQIEPVEGDFCEVVLGHGDLAYRNSGGVWTCNAGRIPLKYPGYLNVYGPAQAATPEMKVARASPLATPVRSHG